MEVTVEALKESLFRNLVCALSHDHVARKTAEEELRVLEVMDGEEIAKTTPIAFGRASIGFRLWSRTLRIHNGPRHGPTRSTGEKKASLSFVVVVVYLIRGNSSRAFY